MWTAPEPGCRSTHPGRPPRAERDSPDRHLLELPAARRTQRLLSLYSVVTQKTLRISKTFGIEGKKLLTPEDDYEALQDFTHAYEGTTTPTEEMHLEFQQLLDRRPRACRSSTPAGARLQRQEARPRTPGAVFFCYALPAPGVEGDPDEPPARLGRKSSDPRPGISTTWTREPSSRSRRRSSRRSAARRPRHGTAASPTRRCRRSAPRSRSTSRTPTSSGSTRRWASSRPKCWMELSEGRAPCRSHRASCSRSALPPAHQLSARRDGLADRVGGLRGPDLRLHSRGAGHRPEPAPPRSRRSSAFGRWSANQPWGIFFVKFEPKRLPVVALRRILSAFVLLKKRASANSAERMAWEADDLLFISNYGEGDERQISFAHFSQDADAAACRP